MRVNSKTHYSFEDISTRHRNLVDTFYLELRDGQETEFLLFYKDLQE